MNVRAVIVDDEPLGRARVVNLLRDHDEIQVIAQCGNGREAVEVIQREQPDLIFLDVQMPDMNGFQVLNKLDLPSQPMVVFATAYDRYALKAFDVHAVDYLLKPFDKGRFHQAVERATAEIKLRDASKLTSRLTGLLDDYREDHEDSTSGFRVRRRGRLVTVRPSEVYWVEAAGNYVALHLRDESHLYRSTMSAFAKELNPSEFLRIHRSYMVNIAFIDSVEYSGHGGYRFDLKNGRELTSSRSYKTNIMKMLARAHFQ